LTFAAPAQASEGWDAVSELYGDGGWSGGTMNRPAMTQLLGDVKAG
jgi:site-specific DNA recombinase